MYKGQLAALGAYDCGDIFINEEKKGLNKMLSVLAVIGIIIAVIVGLSVLSCVCSMCSSACSACSCSSSSSSSRSNCTNSNSDGTCARCGNCKCYGCFKCSCAPEYHTETKVQSAPIKAYFYSAISNSYEPIGAFTAYREIEITYKNGKRQNKTSMSSWYPSSTYIKGYEFTGKYYTDVTLQNEISISDFVENQTYYAKFSELNFGQQDQVTLKTTLPNKYANYSSNNFTIVYGNLVINVPDVQTNIPGYTFLGIYAYLNNGTSQMAFDSDLEVTDAFREAHSGNVWGDVKYLQAEYQPESFTATVNIYAGDEFVSTKSTTVYYDKNILDISSYIQTCLNSNDRYTIDTISITDDIRGTTHLTSMDSCNTFCKQYEVCGNVTVQVHMTLSVYLTLVYNVDGMDNLSTKYPANTNISLPTMNEFNIKPGYEPKGWSRVNGSYMEITEFVGTSIDLGTSDVTLFLIFAPKQFKAKIVSSLDGVKMNGEDIIFYGASPAQLITSIDGMSIEDWINTRDSQEGYTKGGLSTDINERNNFIDYIPENTNDNLTLYFIYVPIDIKVTIDPYHGSVTDYVYNIPYDATIKLPIPSYTSHPQYSFSYYSYRDKNNVQKQLTDSTGSASLQTYKSLKDLVRAGELEFSKLSSTGIIVTAVETTTKLDITYYNGSTKLSVPAEYSKIEYNSLLTYSLTPDNGYDFKGWSTVQDGTIPYNNPVTENMTVYAIFTPKQISYKIEALTDGHLETVNLFASDKITSMPYDSTNNSIELSTMLDTNKYEFLGYFYKDNPTIQATDKMGKLITTFNESTFGMTYNDFLNGSLILIGKVQIHTYDVTYYTSGDAPYKTDTNVNYGDFATDYDIPELDGYDALGWATSRRTSTSNYDDVKFNFATTISSSVTLYAYYEPKTYVITLDPNGGNLAGSTSITVEYNQNLVLEVPTYTDESYEFSGYTYENKYVSDKNGNFTFASLNVTSYSQVAGGITLKAIGSVKQYTVSFMVFDPVAGEYKLSGSDKIYHGQVATDTSIDNLAPYNYNEGYLFRGWSLTEQNNKKYYECTYYDFSTPITQDITLYAVIDNTFKVTYYDTDGITVIQTQYVQYGENWTTALSGKERFGNEFYAWVDKSDYQVCNDNFFFQYNPYNYREGGKPADLDLFAKMF